MCSELSSKNRKNNADNKIDEELVCVDSLRQVLHVCCGYKNIHIHREKHDPPDFTITIEGEPYPAEVTSIVSEQDLQYHSHCVEFANAIRDCASNQGVLFGTYTLKIWRVPRIPKPTSKQGRRLLNDAVNYIVATKKSMQHEKFILVKNKSGELSIRKLTHNGSTVGVIRVPSGIREGEIQNELVELIQQKINSKKQKLVNEGIKPREAILLLYDAFLFAEPTDVISALQKINEYDWFHSIFWAASFSDQENITYPKEPGRKGFFLFSHKKEWDKVGNIQLKTGF